ncbi:MAG: AAA family ATPase, partial [Haloferacaceae archaeon]
MGLEDFSDFSADDDGGDADASGANAANADVSGADAPDAAGSDRIDGGDGGDGPAGSSSFRRYAMEPVGDDAGLGTISVSLGLRVAEEGEDTELRAFITTGNRESVRIGTYLLVPYPDRERLFCR